MIKKKPLCTYLEPETHYKVNLLRVIIGEKQYEFIEKAISERIARIEEQIRKEGE